MKVTSMIITAGIIGLSLGACGTTKAASSSTNTTAGKIGNSSTSTASPTPASATPGVGFNASKTTFVLPHNLGLLPAPELALAKANAAYASGLANAGEWTQIQLHVLAPNSSTPKVETLWGYVGATSANSPQASVIGNTKSIVMSWNGMISTMGGPGAVEVINATSVGVTTTTLNPLFSATTQFPSTAVPAGSELLSASNLEIQAAPVGTLSVKGAQLSSLCVPVPEALLSGGKVVSPSGLPVMTAGPSTVFAGAGAPSGAAPTGVILYDEGIGSCASFK